MPWIPKTILLLLIALCGAPARPAVAYVLRGPHVLELMTRELKRPERLQVDQKLYLFGAAEDGRVVVLDETVRYALPDRFRSEISGPQTQRIHVTAGGGSLSVVDGRVALTPESRFERYKELFLYRDAQRLGDRLRQMGIDPAVTSLGRFQGRIAYVLGARYPDETVSQVWVDKETFRPLRCLFVAGPADVSASSVDIRYSAWQAAARGWYPSRIDILIDQVLVREIMVTRLNSDPRFDPELFDIARLWSRYRPVEAPSPERPVSQGMEEVQETIDDFKKKFE